MAVIVNAANCSVAPAAGGAWVITKTGGDPAAADASAVSTAPIAGDFVLRARRLNTVVGYCGAAADPAGEGFATIDWAVQISGATARVYESGAFQPPLFAVAGFVWLRRTGTVLQYLIGADLATTVLKRTVTGVSGPYYFDSAILTAGGQLEVKFDVPAAFAPTRARRRTLGFGLGL